MKFSMNFSMLQTQQKMMAIFTPVHLTAEMRFQRTFLYSCHILPPRTHTDIETYKQIPAIPQDLHQLQCLYVYSPHRT